MWQVGNLTRVIKLLLLAWNYFKQWKKKCLDLSPIPWATHFTYSQVFKDTGGKNPEILLTLLFWIRDHTLCWWLYKHHWWGSCEGGPALLERQWRNLILRRQEPYRGGERPFCGLTVWAGVGLRVHTELWWWISGGLATSLTSNLYVSDYLCSDVSITKTQPWSFWNLE